jgi:hypothetical protein
VSQCHPMSPEKSNRGTLGPLGLLGRELNCSDVAQITGWVRWEKQKIFELACRTRSCQKEWQELAGRTLRGDIGDSAKPSELRLRGLDGMTGDWPRRLPGCPTEWSVVRWHAQGHSACHRGPTPLGGSLRQLLVPEVLARMWRKWQAGVTL